MKVVLVKDVKGKGKAGDIVNVSDGYASNYLIPNGLAVVGNAGNLSQAQNKKKKCFHRFLFLRSWLADSECYIKFRST